MVKSFTRKKKRLEFELDGDTFYGKSKLPSMALMEFAEEVEVYEKAKDSIKADAMRRIFWLVLEPESAQRFIDRADGKVGEAIDVEDITEVIKWLFEEHGQRPTQPAEPSSNGSGNQESGTSSTEGVSKVELTSEDWSSLSS